jgi:hypothetical protein
VTYAGSRAASPLMPHGAVLNPVAPIADAACQASKLMAQAQSSCPLGLIAFPTIARARAGESDRIPGTEYPGARSPSDRFPKRQIHTKADFSTTK